MASRPLEDLVDERTRALIESGASARTHRRGWIVRRALAAPTSLGLVLAFALAQVVFGRARWARRQVARGSSSPGSCSRCPLWLAARPALGLYDRDEERTDHSTVDDVFGVFNMVTVGVAGFFALAWVTGIADPNLPKLVLLGARRSALISLAAWSRAGCAVPTPTSRTRSIVGAGDVGQRVARSSCSIPSTASTWSASSTSIRRPADDDLGELTVLGDIGSSAADRRRARRRARDRRLLGQDHGKAARRSAPLHPRRAGRHRAALLRHRRPRRRLPRDRGLPLLGLPPARLPRSSLMLKRALDLVGSAVGLLLLSPLFLAFVAIRIKLDSPGPVLLPARARRAGREADRVFKFRTMNREYSAGASVRRREAERVFAELMADPDRQRLSSRRSYKLQDDPRVTKLRRLAAALVARRAAAALERRCVGDLSLVGPRPITLDGGRALRRGRLAMSCSTVKPGITGYWQINGRSDLDYSDRVRLDSGVRRGLVARTRSEILGKTVRALVGRAGAY